MNFILMLIAIFVLGLICVYAYFVIKKEFELARYEENAKKKIDDHLTNVLSRSDQVLEEAGDKMREILAQTHHVSQEIESQAASTFDEFKKRYVVSLNAELTDVEKQYEEQFYKNMKDLRTVLDNRLKEQMQKSDSLVDAFTKSEYERVKKELAEYKKDQEDKIALKAQTMFAKILKEVVEKSLDREDQKNLIWKALESIKKESFSDS